MERRETDTYGATGHLDNPVATVSGDLELGGGGGGGGEREGEEQRPTLERSVNIVTVEMSTPLTLPVDDTGESPNLVQNGDTGLLPSHPLEEQA